MDCFVADFIPCAISIADASVKFFSASKLFHYVVHTLAYLEVLHQAYLENHNILHTCIVSPQTLRLFHHFSDCAGEI